MTVITRHQTSGRDARPDIYKRHAGLDDLIREVVSHVVRARGSVSSVDSECSREEIIVDANVDGVRYLMVRMPSSNSARISLSPREQEICRMVARGYPNKIIAGVLNISSWTVCAHIRRIFAKLGVASRAAMVARLSEESRIWEQRLGVKSTLPPNPRSTATPLRSASASKNSP